MCDRLPEQITAERVQNSTDRQSKGEINKQLKHDTGVPVTIDNLYLRISISESQFAEKLTKHMYEM